VSASSPSKAGVDVDAVATAVTSCPSVLRLSGGSVGQAVTHLPGRRVTGVRVAKGSVEVHVVARWVSFLPDVGDEVRAAVAPLVGGRSVTVIIDDLGTDDGELGGGPAALEPAAKDAGD